MASYTSATRLTGLSSGVDTDSYVEQLMYAASTKYYTYQRNLQKLQWKQTAYRDVANNIKTFQSKWLDVTSSTSLRLQKTFTNKYTSSVTTGNGSTSSSVSISNIKATGAHTIEVKNVATTAKLTSGSVSGDGNTVSGQMDLSSGDSSFKFTYDGVSVDITVAQGSTKEQAQQTIQAALDNAYTDTDGNSVLTAAVDDSGRLTISSSVKGHAMSVKSAETNEVTTTQYAVTYDGTTAKFELSDDENGNYTLNYDKEELTLSNENGNYVIKNGTTTIDTGTSDETAALQALFNTALNDKFGTVATDELGADGSSVTQKAIQAVTADYDEDGNITFTAAKAEKYSVVETSNTVTSSESSDDDTGVKTYEVEYGEDDDKKKITFSVTEGDDGLTVTYKVGDDGEETSATVNADDTKETVINRILGEQFGEADKAVLTENYSATQGEGADKSEVSLNVTEDDGKYTVTYEKDGNQVTLTSEDGESKEDVLNRAAKDALSTTGDVTLERTGASSKVQSINAVTASFDDDGNFSVSAVSSEAKLVSVSHSVESGKSEIKRDVSTTNFSVINSSSKVSTSDKMSSVIGDFKGTKTVTINDVDITIDNDTTISDFMSAINTSDAGVKLSYNSISGTFALETKETGVAQTISLSDENDTKSVFASLGFDTSVTARGTDATIVVDGVTAVSNTNSLAFDEFTADITYATTGETFIVKTDKDTDAIYNMLSDFVSEYNELISGIRSTSTEQRSEGTNGYYEPLTDDEKKEMSESEITKWEAEAKKGLLHSDTLLTGFLSKARATFYSATSVNSNGQKVGLYNLGITTSSDTTKAGELSIDESKLKAAIEDDPDTLMELVNTITDNLNTVVNTYVGSNGLISNKAGIEGTSTEYNNSLYTQITEVKEKMSTELTRLQSKEERYYEMFSNMETFVSDNNTTLDLLTSYFG